MPHQLWTIGHSSRKLSEFINLLQEYKIEILADIRTLPGSNKFPQFNKENLEKSLPKSGIKYLYLEGLGGLRKHHKDSHNTIWHNASFRAYADYMETDEFVKNVKDLMQLAVKKRVCICCSAAVWWRCHRSMVADYLKNEGWKVLHIMAPGKIKEHPYTRPAKIVKGKLVYGQAEENTQD